MQKRETTKLILLFCRLPTMAYPTPSTLPQMKSFKSSDRAEGKVSPDIQLLKDSMLSSRTSMTHTTETRKTETEI